MIDTLEIKLGVIVNGYKYNTPTKQLFISGPAIEEGTWTGLNGVPIYFSRDILHDAANLFNNIPLVCEHRGLVIGNILEIETTTLGFKIKNAVVTHQPSIDAILSKKKMGFSIEANIVYDNIRSIAKKITTAKNISLVENPACKICGITSARTSKGNVIMSAKKAKEDIVDETVVSPETEKIDTEVVESVVTEPTIDTPTKEDPPEVSTTTESTSPTTPVPSVNNVSIKTDSITIESPVEQPFGEVMAALSAATSTVENVSVQLSSAITRLQDMENKCATLEVQLSAKDTEIESIRTEATSYKEKFEALQTQLNTQAENERNSLIADIKTLDPETSNDIIGSMSTVQLSAYKGSLERFSVKGMIAGERKGFRADEAVPELETPVALSANTVLEEPSREQTAKLIFELLRNQSTPSVRK